MRFCLVKNKFFFLGERTGEGPFISRIVRHEEGGTDNGTCKCGFCNCMYLFTVVVASLVAP